GGDALANVAFAVAVGQQRRARLSLHVDESWRDHASGGVDLFAGSTRYAADCDNATVTHCHVGAPRRRAGAVDHLAVADDEVVAGAAGNSDSQTQRANKSEFHDASLRSQLASLNSQGCKRSRPIRRMRSTGGLTAFRHSTSNRPRRGAFNATSARGDSRRTSASAASDSIHSPAGSRFILIRRPPST